MKWIEYVKPTTLDEAIEALADKAVKSRSMAGGTDLIVQLRNRSPKVHLGRIVDLKGISELNGLTHSFDDGLTIGSTVPCYRIYENESINKYFPALLDSARIIGGVPIQGRASFGGNLCNASPSADSISNLIVHDAVANIVGPKGHRSIPVKDFCLAPGKTALEDDEILISINVPTLAIGFAASYLRFTPRNEMDIAVVGAAVSVVVRNGYFETGQVCLSAVAPIPLVLEGVGTILKNQPVSDHIIEAVADEGKKQARPISDMRGTSEFRKHLSAVMITRAFHKAIQRT